MAVKRGTTSIRASEISVASMTGFGKGAAESDRVGIQVELRSVNSRFLDLTLKTPRCYGALEPWFRERISSRISRGRVDLMLTRSVKASTDCGPKFNQALFEAYYGLYETVLAQRVSFDDKLRAEVSLALLGRSEILDTMEEVVDLESEKVVVEQALAAALDALCAMREQEGKRLANDIYSRLVQLRERRNKIDALAPRDLEAISKNLKMQLERIAKEITLDPLRIHAEVALIAEKLDISEETVRLNSHYEQFERSLCERPQGRKLEFLLQEIGREFNTIGSKSQSSEISSLVVEAKVDLERMREQVQNIE